MSKYMLITLALFFVLLAGQFDALQTSRADNGLDTPMYESFQGDTMLVAWYKGGDNHRWNPSFPSIPWLGIWYADFWHTCKFGWISSYAAAIATLACSLFIGWKKRILAWLVIFVMAYGCEGDSFRLGYHNFYRNDPKTSVVQLLLDLNPFVNSH
jgi:hypothetical protein